MHSDTLLIRELCCNFANNTSEIDALRSINSNVTRRSGHKES
jgi:hypothetical protein